MTRKILLTGGAGFIGSHTYVALIDAGFDVVILDNFSNARRDVPDRLRQITQRPVSLIEADVTDASQLERVFKDHAFDGIVHFAALKAVGESVQKPLDYFHVNLTGLTTLLQLTQKYQMKAFVYSSSATIYGSPSTLPISEDAPRSATNPYGLTKLVGEQMLEAISATNPEFSVGILRYFNPVGAHESGMIGEDPLDTPNNLMPYIAKVAVGDLPELRVFGDDYNTPDGTGVRDYIHVVDLARAHVLSLQELLQGQPHTVNIGTGKGYSVLEMLRAYEAASGKSLPYSVVERRAGDVASVYADPKKAEHLLGFSAERDLEVMCADSWRWISSKLS